MQGFSTVLTAAGRQHGRHLASAQTAGLAWSAAAAQSAPELLLMQLELVLISRTVAVCACCALLQAQHTQQASLVHSCIAVYCCYNSCSESVEVACRPPSEDLRRCSGGQIHADPSGRACWGRVGAAGGQPPGRPNLLLQQIFGLGQPCAAQLQTNKKLRYSRGFCTPGSWRWLRWGGCARSSCQAAGQNCQGVRPVKKGEDDRKGSK
jgi:hypothetical protein